jgi:hypothetical protein
MTGTDRSTVEQQTPDAVARATETGLACASDGIAALQRQAGNSATSALLALSVQRRDKVKTSKALPKPADALGTKMRTVSAQLAKGSPKEAWTTLSGLPTESQALTMEQLRLDGSLRKLAGTAPGRTDFLTPWLGTLPDGESMTFVHRVLVRHLIDGCNDVPFLITLAEKRFHPVTFGASTDSSGVQWEPLGLRKAYGVLETLPAAHVAGSAAMLKTTRYDSAKGVSGWFGSGGESAIGYRPGALADKNAGAAADVGDPLHGVNRFNKVVRHEVGHAVDDTIGWSKGGGKSDAKRGGWVRYGKDYFTVAEMIGADAGGPISTLPAEVRTAILTAVSVQMAKRKTALAELQKAVEGAAGFSDLDDTTRAAVLGDKALTAIETGTKTPWYTAAGGGVALGGKIYEEAYDWDGWYSYDADARSRKVSNYQFRAPGEWFAEAYAAYYEPDPRGPGAKLGDSDADTKKWFDEAVANLKPSRPPVSKGGDRGAGG